MNNPNYIKAIIDLSIIANDKNIIDGNVKDIATFLGRNWNIRKFLNFINDSSVTSYINYEIKNKHILMDISDAKSYISNLLNNSKFKCDYKDKLTSKHSDLLINSKAKVKLYTNNKSKSTSAIDNQQVISNSKNKKKSCNLLSDNKRLQTDNSYINKELYYNNNIYNNNIINTTYKNQNTNTKNTEYKILELNTERKKIYKKKETKVFKCQSKKPNTKNMETKFEMEFSQGKSKKITCQISETRIDEIYKMYPSKCIVSGRSLGKSFSDKDKIKRQCKKYGDAYIEKAIKFKIDECRRNNVFMPNFSTFLNNIPDIEEDEKCIIRKPIQIPEDARCLYYGFTGEESAAYKAYIRDAKADITNSKIRFIKFESAVNPEITIEMVNEIVDVVYKGSEIKMPFSVYSWLVLHGELNICLK